MIIDPNKTPDFPFPFSIGDLLCYHGGNQIALILEEGRFVLAEGETPCWVYKVWVLKGHDHPPEKSGGGYFWYIYPYTVGHITVLARGEISL
jgi:hypothetical protein